MPTLPMEVISVSSDTVGIPFTMPKNWLSKRITAAQMKTSRCGSGRLTVWRRACRALLCIRKGLATTKEIPLSAHCSVAVSKDVRRRSSDCLEEALPAGKSVAARKITIEHRAGAAPHFGNTVGICAEAAQGVGQELALAGFHDDPAIMPPNKSRDFAIARGDCDDRSAGCGDPIELARHDQALQLGPQRNQMNVGNPKRELQYFSFLIG